MIYSDYLPARRGHEVSVLTRGAWVVRLWNATTGEAVNYVRHNPPTLLRLADVGVVLGLPVVSIVGLLALGAKSLLISTPIAVLYFPTVRWARARPRRRLQEAIDHVLRHLQRTGDQ